jgi:ubiquitin C
MSAATTPSEELHYSMLVRTLLGKALYLDVQANDSIANVKTAILASEGIPPYQQRLLFGGVELEDEGTLENYGIPTRSTLLLLRQHQKLRVYLKSLTGRTVTIEVRGSTTIQMLKELSREKKGIPPDQQRVICASKELVDDRTMDDYDIQTESTLHLVLCLHQDGYW